MRESRRLLAVWAVGLAFGAACLVGSAGEPRTEDIYRMKPARVRRMVFPSGLEVWVERDASLPAVAVVAVVGAGATRDPPGKDGLAHAVEHFSFIARLADGRTRARTLTDLGAIWNGFTYWDRTTYYELGPRDTLPRLLELEGARLVDPLAGVAEADLPAERDVILNELELHGETEGVGEIIGLLQAATLPAADPYVRPVVGTKRTIPALTLADARAFAPAYRPSDISIYVVGDVDPAAAPELLRVLPAALTGGPPSDVRVGPNPRPRRDAPPSEPNASTQLVHYQGAVAGPELWLAWPLPGAYADTAGIDDVLVDAANSALNEHDLRSMDVSVARLYELPGVRETLLVCRAQLVSGADPQRAFGALASTVSQKWREAVYDGHWYSALRGNTAAHIFLRDEGLEARALIASELAYFVGDPDWMRKRAATLATLGSGAAADFGNRYVVKERARGVFVTPLPPASRPVPRAIGVVRERTPPPGNAVVAAAERSRSAFRASDATRARLRNGLDVIAIHRPGPTLSVLLGFHGGTADGPVRAAGNAFTFAARFQIVRPPSTLGMTLDRRYGRDDIAEVIRGPTISLKSALEFLRQEEELVLDWPSRALFKRVPALAHAEAVADARAERAVAMGLFGGHPYGATPLIKDVLAVSEQQVRDWWLAHRRPDNGVLVVVGDLDEDDVVAAARDALGSWRAPTRPPAGPPPLPAPPLAAGDRPGDVLITHRPGSVQAEITIACLVPPIRNGDTAAADLLADTISDGLRYQLRDRLGATYDVSTRRTSLRGGASYITTWTAIDNAHLPAALSIIRDYWRRGREPLDPRQIDDARWDEVRGGQLALARTDTLARRVFEYWNLDWPLVELEKHPQRLAEVPPQALAPIRDACHDNFVLSLVGDEPTIRGAWH